MKKNLIDLATVFLFYVVLALVMNVLFYVFGLFYYLQYNPVYWSAKTRGTLAVLNSVLLLVTMFAGWLNRNDLND